MKRDSIAFEEKFKSKTKIASFFEKQEEVEEMIENMYKPIDLHQIYFRLKEVLSCEQRRNFACNTN
ncbi:MAG TPA: hypothetical protein ENI34_06075 [candidate division WOR-3 bacterium]|uniref:Uncharacterized protein n=1 Tax=candidate division WOR-3 bacterium TaxID=2052148 RepID=A0A9C9EM78_UNCW3|nr:hypothetical protein [candidate division WOR-3 bacterium]